ncbi:hypothetical protein KGM_201913 [Danaus plexippus plexippus]|uniref:HTH merR-type domain-containing protein n=1 Tax=Danaus plexippus plexippus TaxID=278856 RepID=A0A212EKZ8_DANPL|nr:hypothetical protein KGM_201913 [Danaus plexippus plexippus]
METSLSEICELLGDRIERYNRRKRKSNVSNNRVKKLKSSKLVSPVASSTPIDIKSKPQEAAHAVNCSDVESPISSVSVTYLHTLRGSQNRRCVRRTLNIQPKKLIFDIEED